MNELDPTEDVIALALPPAAVACMGTQACRRVCAALRENMPVPELLESADALPYEYVCPVLDELAEADGSAEVDTPISTYRRELAQAIAIPTLEFLGEEGTVTETKAYMTHLQESHKEFEAYIETLLAGASLPRSAAIEAAEEWRTNTYESPYADKLGTLTEDEQAGLQGLYAQVLGFHDRATLKQHRILFDASIQSVLEQAANEISVGHHVSFSGEPGVAKSSLAKYLGYLNARAHHPDWFEEDCMPVLISMSSTSEAEAQVNEQTFEDNTLSSRLGLVAQAMKDGRMVILDEQNGMTADQQVYFNDLFLKKPGDVVRIGNEMVTIAKGFGVIATLNPMTDTQGNRRHGRQQQDSAGAARYTRIDMKYPGQEGYPGEAKETIVRLFYANYAEHYGWQMPSTEVMKVVDQTQEFLGKLVKKATEAPTDGTTTASALAPTAARPDLAECITPRDFSRILERIMTHADLTALPQVLLDSIEAKTLQILNSDNGHYVTPAVANAIRTDLDNSGMKTYA